MKGYKMFYDVIEEMNEKIEDYIEKYAKKVSASEIGLDPRCGYCFIIEDEGLVIPIDNIRKYNYYGGFEYISEEERFNFGNYVYFNYETERVNSCIEHYKEKKDK